MFFRCQFVIKVWETVFGWFGIARRMIVSLLEVKTIFESVVHGMKARRASNLVWVSTVWLIWKQRNAAIFNMAVYDVPKVLDEIKVITWQWFSAKLSSNQLIFSDWCLCPLGCINAVI
jgi:hypothetical protein